MEPETEKHGGFSERNLFFHSMELCHSLWFSAFICVLDDIYIYTYASMKMIFTTFFVSTRKPEVSNSFPRLSLILIRRSAIVFADLRALLFAVDTERF